MRRSSRRLRILTWHVHGNYLYYLSHVPHEFYLPVKPGRPPGYGGRAGAFAWPNNVHEVRADAVKDLPLDAVLFQARAHYAEDQYTLLSAAQRRLPRIYLEHDPPREHPTDTRHVVDDPDVQLVHVTHFNALMWDSGRTPTRVIEHGVVVPPEARYTGEVARGVVVINNLRTRGRRLGADVFERVREDVPLDLIGMDARAMGGVGEVPPPELPARLARYRFFFNPIRYTSLGLAVCEAMMVGLPIVALATSEMVTVVEHGVSGYLDTNLSPLITRMRTLLRDPAEARHLGAGARQRALERFGIERFIRDWDDTLRDVAGYPRAGHGVARHSMAAGAVT
jgi:glycosyltransferase involved in cell wall biosynthesis